MTNKKHEKFYMAFNHNDFKVKTVESAITGEKVTIVTFPTAMQAWMQLHHMLFDLNEIIYGTEDENESSD